MELKNGFYYADKGKYFVLTEKGKKENASYQNKTVNEPVREYDTEAVHWDIEEGYLVEVPIPDWIVKEGFEVVYDYNGSTLQAGDFIIFPELEIAQKYMENYSKRPWFHHELYIRPSIFEGRSLKECREYNGKKVYNNDWYYGTDALKIEDLVEQEIVDDIINCLPPACMRNDCVQFGSPASSRIDENGNDHATYETFKKIAENTWEYCGDCFRGENFQRGTLPAYLMEM